MDERFFRAWFSRPGRVLGRQLKPYTLTASLVLEAVESPFCDDNAPFTPLDLSVAVRVCSSVDPISALQRRPGWRERWEFEKCRWKPSYFEAEAALFISYIQDSSEGPRLNPKDDMPVRPYPVPWQIEVASGLLRFSAMSRAEVWDLPVGHALWYYVMLQRQAGRDLDIITTDMEAALRSKLDWVGKTKAEMEAAMNGQG